jgi:tetratricopeptide (TPR) repeat protein
MALVILLLVLAGLRIALTRSLSVTARAVMEAPGKPGPSASASDWVRWGNDALRRHGLGSAREAFEHAKQLDPTLAPARLGLIWIHALRMERAQALAEFAELAALRPLDFDQALLWTQIRCSAWDQDKVVPQLQVLLENDPSDRGVRLTLGEGLRRLGRPAEALEVVASLGGSDPEALAIRARLALDRGDLTAAEVILAQAPSEHPELAELRGQSALMRRNGPNAVAQFQRALAARPDDRGCLSGLAQALRLSGQAQAAEPWLQTVHRLDTLLDLVRRAAEMTHRDDPELLRALGAACAALQLVPEARAWYGLAIARDPLNSESQIALYRLRNATATPRP